MRPLLLLLMTALLTACRTGGDQPIDGLAPINLDAMPIQYGFGGQFIKSVELTREHRAQLAELFTTDSPSPDIERQRIRAAVALLECIAGEQTPIRHDAPMNTIGPAGNGQTDCLDESANTTTFLRVLDQHDLLRWHTVYRRAHRAPMLIDAHNTAVVRDTTTGVRWAVDTWFRPNGVLPLIQPLDDWFAQNPFSREHNPDLPRDFALGKDVHRLDRSR